jgi:hypothetical protein
MMANLKISDKSALALADQLKKQMRKNAQMRRQLAALDWREITETDLPEIGQQVLACFKGQFQWVIFPATMTRHQGVFAVGHAKPTHWMPMPAPPAPRSCEEHEWLTR